MTTMAQARHKKAGKNKSDKAEDRDKRVAAELAARLQSRKRAKRRWLARRARVWAGNKKVRARLAGAAQGW